MSPFRPLPDVASDPALVARIRDEIRRRGPMTFARFMEIALYDPHGGYYMTEESRPTRAGDFLTAPELHPIFGQALARQVVEVWQRLGRPQPFVVREFGAGSGALAAALLGRLATDASPLFDVVRYQPVERNPHRVAELEARFAAGGLQGRLERAAGPMTGVVIANEFLDALPFHRVEGNAAYDGALAELFVVIDGDGLREKPGPPSTPVLAARLAAEGVALASGQRAEVRLADGPWIASLAEDLRAGVAIVVDYALPADDLYSTRRMAGTLVAYLGHVAHGDPFQSIGRQDLTAHVDLTALERSARGADLDVLGATSQAEFLVGCGLEQLVEDARSDERTGLAAWSELRASVARLLDPRATGGFRVVVLGQGMAIEPALAGLAFRLHP
ncbi:MAG TPA: SAM-dependent methyltransferase [Candidatus Limnocylindrales bacterium]